MFVVFWTIRSTNPGVFFDSYVICDDEEHARKFLDEVLEQDSTYAAGMGPITYSSEH